MAKATVTFCVRSITKEIFCDATNEDEFIDWLDNNPDEYADLLTTNMIVKISDAEYDLSDESEEIEDDGKTN